MRTKHACVLVLGLLSVTAAQKLFFRPLAQTNQQQEQKVKPVIYNSKQAVQNNKGDHVIGFGFKEPRHYFTKPRTAVELANENNKEEHVIGFGFKEPRHYFTKPRTAVELANENVKAVDVVCPGSKSACATGNTCCLMINKAYGCCDMPNAVCCSDEKHCCPFGSKCDVKAGHCSRGDVTTSWYASTPAMAYDSNIGKTVPVPDQLTADLVSDDNLDTGNHGNLGVVMCPDGEHECENEQTCCKSPDGYNCCPLPKAVCCSDEIHCCPADTECDLAASKCNKKAAGNQILDWFTKLPAKKSMIALKTAKNVEAVQCDDRHECPTGNTCCKLASGDWGCCPRPNAVCCEDHIHCCPSGTTCGKEAKKCQNGSLSIDWLEKQPAHKIKADSVKCSGCPDGNTCCKLASGQWGCCPVPNAVCCSDHIHCCPNGTTCDTTQGKCNHGDTQIDWFEKQPVLKIKEQGVQCDSSHECPDGNTCCKLASGQWGCCPIPNAVCCSDQTHCCPEGTTCSVSSGKCQRGDTQIDWFEKQPVLKIKEQGVQCDSSHECPDGNTCCKLTSGQWGCCPIPNAVCCSDQTHCCPEGTTCSVSSGKCQRGDTQIDWFEKQPVLKIKEQGVQCDSSHECPDGNTCCKLASGQWGCCPIPNAVCCSDQTHCCPEGTTCSVSSGKCQRGDTQIDWFEKQPVLKIKEQGVQCDSSHECPDGNTCCKLASGQWGCCPIPNAVCCSDQTHCCPEGTTCSVSSGKCQRGDTQIDWFEKQPVLKIKEQGVQCDSSHECPDGNTCCKLASGQWGCCPIPNKQPVLKIKEQGVQCDSSHECPDGNTCCKLASGQWGCCPIPNAVCCSDQTHCCPEGTTCSVSSGKCQRGDTQIDWFEKQPVLKIKEQGVQCDSSHECPDGNTCCKLASGQWGCCPIPNAVCCSDQTHCCPEGTTCSVSSGKCQRGDTQIDWFEKQPVLKIKEQGVQCDSSHECPDGNTCCKLASGQWGCCPIPNAVCCSDQTHCCPEGTTCSVSSGKCQRGDTQIDWFEKQPVLKIKEELVKCDSAFACPDRNTCCKVAGGQWGCCPLPKAVCCSDGTHCCPSGTTCDVSSGKCNRGDTQIDWFEKQPVLKIKADLVKCDALHDCPDRNTCCKLSSGQWGCCPLPNAVCCSDGTHCCPSGTTCDVSSGKCNRGDTQIDWFEKQPVLKIKADLVKCDALHDCPDRNTCCKLSSGQWGCCPLPNAVCCSDGTHCCPSGTTCDVSSGKCNRGDTQIDWFEKQPVLKIKADLVKCDALHDCPDRNTCCKLSSGQWGCCPLPNAVCCSDGTHCCPSGTTCDVSSGKCNRGDTQIDWFEKQPALKIKEDLVKCDALHDCPTGNTCCKLPSGQWGCCPLPKAVCCSDGTHCCPSGTTCDVSSGKCNRGDTQIDWFEKQPVLKIKADSVKCDDQHECPDGNTCCKLSSGQWGCCPLPQAVCCSDGTHCCPRGTTCDVSSGKCNRGDTQIDWFEKQPVLKIKADSVKCDDQHECPDGNTCCKLSSGQWGCCPLPQAVCCSDGTHCCPRGTTCDVSSGKCNRGDTQIDWFEKQPVLKIKEQGVQCDTSHECPDGNTCCKLSSGQWGCCPLPNAVCCSDGTHCCPNGDTCDVASGKCNHGDTQIDWFEKQPVLKIKEQGVQCDSSHECPDGNTCCKLSSGQWGCCPLPNAVCCSDGTHCCPNGDTCDVASGKCNHGDTQIDWFEKQPVLKIKEQGVQCDSTHECPDGNTCCKLSSGQWGCCPLPNAVCCSGGNCCPNGHTCDVSIGLCNSGDMRLTSVDMVKLTRANMVTCPDGSECADGQTCCPMDNVEKTREKDYGCCPLPNAVCCSDLVHCCPEGYRCNPAAGACISEHTRLPWLQTIKHDKPQEITNLPTTSDSKKVVVNSLLKTNDIKCPNGDVCPGLSSCCPDGKGGYSCCPEPQGICCSDHSYCCPHGYICDTQPGICRIPEVRKSASNFLSKLSSRKATPHQ